MSIVTSLSAEEVVPVRSFDCIGPASHLPACADKELDPVLVQTHFLAAFSEALATEDWHALDHLFVDDCYFKDHLALTGGLRTIRGKKAVLKAMASLCPLARTTPFTSYSPKDHKAKLVRQQDLGFCYVDFAASFNTGAPPAQCTAWIKLVCLGTEWQCPSSWQAWLFFTAMDSIIGHEEEDFLAQSSPDLRTFATTGIFPRERSNWPLSHTGAPGGVLYDAERLDTPTLGKCIDFHRRNRSRLTYTLRPRCLWVPGPRAKEYFNFFGSRP